MRSGFTSLLSASLDRALEQYFGPGEGSLAPSAVTVVARHGEITYERAVGDVDLDTLFDLASVTKAAFTASMLMALVDEGTLDLEARLGRLLPELSESPLAGVTVTELLQHRAGFWEWRPVYFHAANAEAAIQVVLEIPPRYAPGTVYAYSDLGLMVAGQLLQRLTGCDLEMLLRDRIQAPLGLRRTTFRPSAAWRDSIAPTSSGDWYERRMVETGQPYPVPERGSPFSRWRTQVLVGEANDGNAFHAFGGVAGHAGLFASAGDLARIGTAVLSGELASRATLERFARAGSDPGQGLVFRLTELAGERALWHPGFTGTRWLICPGHELVVVLLSNRLHVRGEPRPIDEAWEAVVDGVAAALTAG